MLLVIFCYRILHVTAIIVLVMVSFLIPPECWVTHRHFAQAMGQPTAVLLGSSGSLVSTARATRPTLLSAASQAGASTTATTGVMST